tara:strand:- start:855 stop:3344 length:2490 start_codon:yes stop_codon:yes gene_type:complete
MPLISTSIPNLNGGVSQQPSAQRLTNQCEAQENAIPMVVGGLIKRPPSNHVSELKTYGTDGTDGASLDLSNAFVHTVQRDASEKFFITLKGDDNVYINGIDGSPKEVHKNFTTVGCFNSSNPKKDFRAVTVGDTTFVLNTSLTVSTTGTTPSSTATYEALVWVRSTGVKFSITVTAAGNVGDYGPPSDTNPPSTSDIAAHLESDLDGGNADGQGALTAESKGSVLYITRAVDFEVTAEDSLGQNGHKVIKGKVNKFSDLPPIAKHGMIVKVEGDPEEEVDDYYVQFEVNDSGASSGDMGTGIWVEAAKPGIVKSFNHNSMPHIIVRQADGSYVVKPADGQDPSTGNYTGTGAVDWSIYKWSDREAGSDLTNPLPSFVDQKITGMSFFKNRLAFISGENCILSETGFVFNFFRTTSTFLLDTEVIDVGVGGTEVNLLGTLAPFSDRLILFSESTQFALQGDGILSPNTASITAVTNYDVLTDVTPKPAGSALFFGFNRGSFSGVREYFKTNETDINFDAVEVTSQAPKYIEGDIRKMVVSTSEDLVVVLSQTKAGASYNATNNLFVYKYFNGSEGRIQSAWFKFTFDNLSILDVEFIDQSLYMIVKRGSKTFLERVDIQTGLVDEGADYTTLLDRRVKITGDGAESPAAGYTITLPYDIVDGDTVQVCDSTGEVRTIASQTANTITLEEEFSATEVFYVGTSYTMRYELTPPVLKRPKPGGGTEMIAVGRHQLRYMTVVFDDTAFFKVRFSTKAGGGQYTDPVEYPFSGRYLSSGGFLGAVPSETGDFRFPMFSESDTVKIEILNDSPLPSNIQSLEFEAFYTSRSQRAQ